MQGFWSGAAGDRGRGPGGGGRRRGPGAVVAHGGTWLAVMSALAARSGSSTAGSRRTAGAGGWRSGGNPWSCGCWRRYATLTAHLITVLLPGVVLDWLLGDSPLDAPPGCGGWDGPLPGWRGVLRRVFPRDSGGERAGGALLALLIPAAFGGGSWLLLEG